MSDLKITDIKLRPAGKYLFVQVETNEGIVGIGEDGVWGFLGAAESVIDKFKEYLVGKDPFKIEHYWNYLYRSMYFRGSIVMAALSAIDIALWDIKGKALGVPVYELLGGKVRDKARSYDVAFEFTPEGVAKGAKELKKDGFTAMRLLLTGNGNDQKHPQLNVTQGIFSHKIAYYTECVKAVRDAVGDDFDILMDVHRSLSVPEAIELCNSVEKYHPYYIEDPIAPDNFDILSDLNSHINIPIADGERNINIQEHEMLIRRGVQYVRPDMCVCGGITAGKKIAAIAEASYSLVVPHNPLGPVSTAACLQLAAAIPNFAIMEFPSFYRTGHEKPMIKEPFTWKDGYMDIPDRPGLGVELVDDLEEKFPVAQRSLGAQRAWDGSVVDI